LIDELFQKGSSFVIYPLKVLYLPQPASSQAPQVLITVPKRNFKRAVDRNTLKRRIKEAFRLHKHLLRAASDSNSFIIGYIYIGKEIADYQTIAGKLKMCLLRLSKKQDQ
jgi:ribonuclease P protein component